MKDWLVRSRFLLAVVFAVVMVGIWYSGVVTMVSLTTLQEKRSVLVQCVQTHYGSAVAIYILLYIAIVLLALPVAALATMAGGWLFGVLPAVIYVNIGATLGALGSFLMVRFVIGDFVQQRYKKYLATINRQLHTYGPAYLIGVHLIAIIPFFVINMIVGLTKVSVTTFIWTTSLGIIPTSILYATAGRHLAQATEFSELFSPTMVGIAFLLAGGALLPLIIQALRRSRRSR
jgi:uncharacterized membrane protein YdjX (TVP38/TMEM64 family)